MGTETRITGSLVRSAGTLEQAVAALLGKFNKVQHAAEHCRVGPKQLSAYANPNSSGRHMPVDVVRDLESAAHDPVVSRCLAAYQRHALYRLPRAIGHGVWERHQRKIVTEGSEVFVMLTEVLEEGRMSRQEAAALLVEIDDAISAFAALRGSLKLRMERRNARVTTT